MVYRIGEPMSAGLMREPSGSIDTELWDRLIRSHDRSVWLSLVAIGVKPESARELAQSTWMRLMEKHAAGELDGLELPGLAIRQARFLALDELRRDQAEQRRVEEVLRGDAGAVPLDAERQIAGRQELERVAIVLAGCAPSAQRLFQLLYGRGLSHAEAASALGLSVQRARQLLCETRRRIREAFEEDV
jgi:RNA polymerase sigma-70 factor (ECF subfamily)